jgi:autotransporter family porin
MKRRSAYVLVGSLTGAAILVIAAVVGFGLVHNTSSNAVYFHTLPVGAKLPSGAECARLVQESPSPENRPGNVPFNDTVGFQVSSSIFPTGDSAQVQALASRINGDFTGTTKDILRWAACKWGIDQDIVFAQAAVESWWRQTELGDWQSDPALCPPGHEIGVDGRAGECPESYGILQNKYTFFQPAWPGSRSSTAMNADVTYAIWRSCYDGDEVWLNDQPRGKQYQAGDVWGCLGRWFAGAWYTSPAESYISRVQTYLNEQVWAKSSF